MLSKCHESGTGQEQSTYYATGNLLASQAFHCVNWISLNSPKSVDYLNLVGAQWSSTQEAKQKYFKVRISFFLLSFFPTVECLTCEG